MKLTRRKLFLSAVASASFASLLRAEDEPLPAYHKNLPTGPLPQTKDPNLYNDKPVVKMVYGLAGKVRPVLYQMPCYCSCDKFAGHGSLLDCFVDAHGEECAVCQREAVYSYEKSQAGVSIRKIRAGIIAGEWRQVDMSPSRLASL